MSHDFVTYEEFGEIFFREAVSRERILEGVEPLAAEPIKQGPMSVGPGGAATVTVEGSIATPEAVQVEAPVITWMVTLPISLDLTVDLTVNKAHFHADLRVPLRLSAHATRDLKVVIDVETPTKEDIELTVEGDGLSASLVEKVADIDDEIRSTVVKYVQEQVDRPDQQESRVIDVKTMIADS